MTPKRYVYVGDPRSLKIPRHAFVPPLPCDCVVCRMDGKAKAK